MFFLSGSAKEKRELVLSVIPRGGAKGLEAIRQVFATASARNTVPTVLPVKIQ
jgi:hypothetical protein